MNYEKKFAWDFARCVVKDLFPRPIKLEIQNSKLLLLSSHKGEKLQKHLANREPANRNYEAVIRHRTLRTQQPKSE